MMTGDMCKPGLVVETPFGTGWLLYPVPKTARREWMVYIEGKAYRVRVEDMRIAEEQGE